MTSILDFKIKYRSDDEKWIAKMSVSTPLSHEKKNKSSIQCNKTKEEIVFNFLRPFSFCSTDVLDLKVTQ